MRSYDAILAQLIAFSLLLLFFALANSLYRCVSISLNFQHYLCRTIRSFILICFTLHFTNRRKKQKPAQKYCSLYSCGVFALTLKIHSTRNKICNGTWCSGKYVRNFVVVVVVMIRASFRLTQSCVIIVVYSLFSISADAQLDERNLNRNDLNSSSIPLVLVLMFFFGATVFGCCLFSKLLEFLCVGKKCGTAYCDHMPYLN